LDRATDRFGLEDDVGAVFGDQFAAGIRIGTQASTADQLRVAVRVLDLVAFRNGGSAFFFGGTPEGVGLVGANRAWEGFGGFDSRRTHRKGGPPGADTRGSVMIAFEGPAGPGPRQCAALQDKADGLIKRRDLDCREVIATEAGSLGWKATR